jgi:hypothetical protein
MAGRRPREGGAANGAPSKRASGAATGYSIEFCRWVDGALFLDRCSQSAQALASIRGSQPGLLRVTSPPLSRERYAAELDAVDTFILRHVDIEAARVDPGAALRLMRRLAGLKELRVSNCAWFDDEMLDALAATNMVWLRLVNTSVSPDALVRCMRRNPICKPVLDEPHQTAAVMRQFLRQNSMVALPDHEPRRGTCPGRRTCLLAAVDALVEDGAFARLPLVNCLCRDFIQRAHDEAERRRGAIAAASEVLPVPGVPELVAAYAAVDAFADLSD